MGGIANQGKALGDEAPRDAIAERDRDRLGGDFDLAELEREARLELPLEILRLERQQRLGVIARLVPNDARASARQRQDRERTGGKEVLFGATGVIALMRDRGDDRRLSIVPADSRDIGERAQLRARAVGGDDQARALRDVVKPSPRSYSAEA